MLHFEYIIFNSNDDNKLKENPDGYYTICLKDLENIRGVKVVSQPLDYMPKLVRFFYCLHTSRRTNRYIRLPFQKIWYPKYFKKNKSREKPYCFVFLTPIIPEGYYKYLKKTYPNCKIVAVHRDLLIIWKNVAPHFIRNVLFDLEYTFDIQEAQKYGMEHFDEFESKIELSNDAFLYPKNDVFFAGKAKDRLPRLLGACKLFNEHGFKCLFYVTEVPSKQRVAMPGMVYADKQMSYREMLLYSNNSKCLLDINQAGASGFTSRFLEAVMYNKILITDNQEIKNSKFYNPKYIQCIDRISDIDTSIIDNSDSVDFHYAGEFSPKHLIEQIDAKLTEAIS